MSNWLKVTGLFGSSAVILGAIGAHAFKASSDVMRETWKTAASYHLVHTVALGMSALHFQGRKRNIVCWLFTSGIILFSGALYTVVLMDSRKPAAQVAPVGEVLFIAGWLAFGLL